jgi:S-adenosylmethionine:tRNA ribosyltransferase-isomerase
MIPKIRIEDYNYPLPDNRIAKYPLPRRDASKLLRYEDGKVSEYIFRDIPELLPGNALMIFNDTKVVPARLHFQRETGAKIEIFCLEPVDPVEYNLAFASKGQCSWKCVIGNAKKWKGDTLFLYNPELNKDVISMDLRAELKERNGETGIVKFSWKGDYVFSQVLEMCGTIPIPPYLNRESESIDIQRYQTLYAKIRGSVAAPTAGLHFTDEVLSRIRERGIDMENVCLHVGAGTFLPVKSQEISGHPMHREPFAVPLSLLKTIRQGGRPIVAVGTTSVRTLESLYYVGVKCIEDGKPSDVAQWDPYEREYAYSMDEALNAIIKYLEDNNLDELKVGTRIIIVPGFKFRLVDMLVTNFHQPESTLILLISAFVGGDWKTIYDYALSHEFRFLSYGDSSLLSRVDKSRG